MVHFGQLQSVSMAGEAISLLMRLTSQNDDVVVGLPGQGLHLEVLRAEPFLRRPPAQHGVSGRQALGAAIQAYKKFVACFYGNDETKLYYKIFTAPFTINLKIGRILSFAFVRPMERTYCVSKTGSLSQFCPQAFFSL